MCCVFILVRVRRPPIATSTYTLCPYTPIFRSQDRHAHARAAGTAGRRSDRSLGSPPRRRDGEIKPPPPGPGPGCGGSGGAPRGRRDRGPGLRSEEHTSELQSLMRISYAVFWLTKKTPRKKRIKCKRQNIH